MLRPMSESRASHAQARERSPAKDQARIEHQVDDVRHPEQAHGDGRVSSAAKDCVVEKEQQHGETSADANSGVTAADGDDLGRCAHQSQQIRRKQSARKADCQGNHQAESDRLYTRDRCAFGIFLSDAARYHGGRRQAQAHGHGEH